MQIRNIGIFAHVDAGKTTLSEQLLVHAGAVRTQGSVDAGTSHTDTLPVERRRGISVKAACVQLTWKDVLINLIDTPGHVDFSAEIERSLWALDGAVLVISAAEGVQPQTEALFAALKDQHIPCLIFINKIDRQGADPDRVLRQIRSRLHRSAFFADDSDGLCEAVCETDEALLERYLNGDAIDRDTLTARLREMIGAGDAYPVYCGSALRDIGVPALLDAVVDWLPQPDGRTDTLCGVVFSSAQDKAMGRGVWVRLYGGSLAVRDALTLPGAIDPATGQPAQVQKKIFQIRDARGRDVGELNSGEIGLVYGLGDIGIGQVVGDGTLLPRRVAPGTLRTPLMTVQALPQVPDQMEALRQACEVLSDQDPLLQARYSRTLGELHLHVMGVIQLQILQEELQTRFGLNVTFTRPAVIYRQTVARECTGFAAYVAPKPCWAIMKFVIEPGERGSGVTFRSVVPVRELPLQYQNQIRQALPLALSQGRLGWQVTDVAITLVEGNSHQFHTHPLDFIVATPWAIHDGLQRGGSVLLQPILNIRFLLPPQCVGRVMSDVATMRGQVVHTQTDEDRVILTALVPVATSMEYSAALASFTGGRGAMSVRLQGYRECPLELGSISPRRNVDPLDTSRYILAARSALDGGIFDI